MYVYVQCCTKQVTALLLSALVYCFSPPVLCRSLRELGYGCGFKEKYAWAMLSGGVPRSVYTSLDGPPLALLARSFCVYCRSWVKVYIYIPRWTTALPLTTLLLSALVYLNVFFSGLTKGTGLSFRV